MDEESTPRRAASAGETVPSIKKRLRTTVRPRIDASGAGSLSTWRLSDLLSDIARTYGVQIVSDSYWTSPMAVFGQPLPAVPVTLETLLQQFTGGGHRWERDGTWLTLRSKTWYFDRLREIPLRLTRGWKASVDARGALPLATYVQLSAALTEAQLHGLRPVLEQVGLPQDPLALPAARPLLQLYSSLTAAQRQSLETGQLLPLTAMTSRQRDLYSTAVRDRRRRRGAGSPGSLGDPRTAGLSLRKAPFVRIAERRGASVAFRAELPAESATAPARPSRVPSPGAAAASTGTPPRAPSVAAPATPPPSGERHPVTQLVFTLSYGANEREIVALTAVEGE
jgi:hypothetical protein